MTRERILSSSLLASLILLIGCSSKLPCSSVPMTAPWDTLNLPIGTDSAVCRSSSTSVLIVQRGDVPSVGQVYTDALAQAGWQLTDEDLSNPELNFLNFAKDQSNIRINVYILDYARVGKDVIAVLIEPGSYDLPNG